MSTILHDPLKAADPQRSAWVSANAGAGKTHTLANRVTRLLLDGARPERILCLTYTKAAAAEMQTRLFKRLGEWAMMDDAKLAASIAEIGAPALDSEGLKRARRLFALALETPGGLRIQTIHAFCQYLLARFPLEARVPPGFRVLEDQTARDMIADARARVLERAGSGDDKLAAAVAHLVTETSEFRLNQILDAALGNDRKKIERFFAELPDGEHALGDAMARAHGATPRMSVDAIRKQFCELAEDEREELGRVASWLETGSAKDKEAAARLRKFLEAAPDDRYGFVSRVVLTGEGERRKSLVTRKLSDSKPALAAYLDNLAGRFVETEHRCRAARAALLAGAALTLADAVREIYAAAKRSAGFLDYDDLIGATLDLLDKSDAAAWVLYKLDGGIDHVLIDEAQDTSPEQWQIVRKLTEESVSGSGARDLFDKPRTIFAVGDEKQSIFSFQGADPAAFETNRQYFAGRVGAGFADVRLKESRRSAPEVLKFVDAVFSNPEARAGLTSGDQEVEHEVHRKQAVGYVEFWPTVKPLPGPEPDPWEKPVDLPSEHSPVVRLAIQIAQRIKAWIANGTTLPDHDHPIRPGDIMILMPRREPFASEIIRRLTQAGVPVAGADRIRLKTEIAVMDLMALGRFVLIPEDDLNLAALLRSPLIDVSEEELLDLCNSRTGALWRALQQRKDERPVFGFAAEFLSSMLDRADFSPPYEFFAAALLEKGVRSRLLARLGPEARDAIDEFLSLSLQYGAANTPSLEGFLHWMDRGDAEIKRDMEHGRDEVRVMTVHGAKGLEADIVILPDTTSVPDPPGRRGDLIYREDGIVYPIRKQDAAPLVQAAKDAAKADRLKEHRRLLYVALTRAKDRLYIAGFEGERGLNKDSWYKLAEAAAKSIGTAVRRGDEDVLAIGDDREGAATLAKPTASKPQQPDWMRTVPRAASARPPIIRPSDDAGLFEPPSISPGGAAGADRFQRGLLVHTLLARLPEIARHLRKDIALQFLAARGVSTAESEEITRQTFDVLDHADFAAAFAPGSRAEVAIVADLPELDGRLNGRIDRLAVTDGHVLAVDFKTNRAPPKRVEDAPEAYVRQMALYRLALAKVFPGRTVSCALVWTDGPNLMALPDSLLDAHIAAAGASLDLP